MRLQVLWNPIFGIMFFSYVALLEVKGIDYVINKTKTELLTQAHVFPASISPDVFACWRRLAGNTVERRLTSVCAP